MSEVDSDVDGDVPVGASSDGAVVTQPRTSERGAATRSSLLAAAREVFVSKGFAEAGVTDVVARAEASVGSLYHHFSGKADLYLTLWEEFQARQTQRTKEAARAARAAGESDPMGGVRACRARVPRRVP
ncbi:TetR/AcrR family transcriptional regulator [Nonomuraea salmonea]|uniref:TetR/AcrR family transcriptional regulator n=1 Tax=Nonomuraea salmonea TaxID=46181 RepID=UPI002FEA34C5